MKKRDYKFNLKISRISPPKDLISNYRVLGGPGNELLLNVAELTEIESNYLLCQVLDQLKIVGAAIETGNIAVLLKSLGDLKRFYQIPLNESIKEKNDTSSINKDSI